MKPRPGQNDFFVNQRTGKEIADWSYLNVGEAVSARLF